MTTECENPAGGNPTEFSKNCECDGRCKQENLTAIPPKTQEKLSLAGRHALADLLALLDQREDLTGQSAAAACRFLLRNF